MEKKISKETSLLIESLEYVLKAENSALNAYYDEYGDPEGDPLWQESPIKESVDNLKQTIKITIGDFMERRMGEKDSQEFNYKIYDIMLGKEQKRIYLNISEGKIQRRTDGGVQSFDFVEGNLEKIYSKDRAFRGEKVPYWYLDIRDPKTKDLYSLGISAKSGVWRSIILSLGSEEFNPLLPVKINPYKKGEYDRVSVYSGDQRLDWVSDLPPVEEIEVQGQKIKSVAKRERYILSLVEKTNSRVSNTPRG